MAYLIEKTPKEIKTLINNPNSEPIILDVREKWEYDICHIENSLHIPMGQVSSRKNELNKNGLIIVVCHHGIRSRIVGRHLTNDGFTNIMNLSGGVDLWATEIDQTMSKYV